MGKRQTHHAAPSSRCTAAAPPAKRQSTGIASVAPSQQDIEDTIMSMLQSRRPGTTMCPSEAPRKVRCAAPCSDLEILLPTPMLFNPNPNPPAVAVDTPSAPAVAAWG
jgi:Protein of unknown function (DUF3253)